MVRRLEWGAQTSVCVCVCVCLTGVGIRVCDKSVCLFVCACERYEWVGEGEREVERGGGEGLEDVFVV